MGSPSGHIAAKHTFTHTNSRAKASVYDSATKASVFHVGEHCTIEHDSATETRVFGMVHSAANASNVT